MRVRGRPAISASNLDRGLGLSQGLRALHEIGVAKSALRLRRWRTSDKIVDSGVSIRA